MAEIKCQESYDAGYDEATKDSQTEINDAYDRGFVEGEADGHTDGYNEGFSDGQAQKFDVNQKDDLRFTVRVIKAGDGEQAIFSLCRALGDDTEAAEVVRNEWRRK